MSNNYYSDWDKWFAEEHDGTPVEFFICDGYLKGDADGDPNNLSLCASQPGDHKLLDCEERHVIQHRFTASSYIGACTKRNEILGWEPYKPSDDWDVENGCYRD